MQTVASSDSKYKLVESLIKKIMNFVGFVILFYVCFKTYNQYKDILTMGQIKSFLLPPIFTFLFLPFVYGLAIFMKYETIFSRLPFIVKEKKLRALVKNQIIRTAQLNIDKLTAISYNISRIEIVDETNLSEKIERICKTSLISIK